MKYNNLEFQWSDVNERYELVKWEGSSCFVIAFFEKHKEGYDMRTVGNRFFEHEGAFLIAKHALCFLNEVFKERGDDTI